MTRNAGESRPLAPLRHAVGIGAHVQRNTGSQNPLISMGRVLSSDHAACTVTVRPGPPRGGCGRALLGTSTRLVNYLSQESPRQSSQGWNKQ
jgi:hypothetical protein